MVWHNSLESNSYVTVARKSDWFDPSLLTICKYLLISVPALNCKPLGFLYIVLQEITYAYSSDLCASSLAPPQGENSRDTKILLWG